MWWEVFLCQKIHSPHTTLEVVALEVARPRSSRWARGSWFFIFLLVLGGFWGVGVSGEGRGGPGGGPGGPGGGPGALEVVDLEVARSRTSMRTVYYF